MITIYCNGSVNTVQYTSASIVCKQSNGNNIVKHEITLKTVVTFVAFLSSMMWLSWEWQLCFAFVLNKLAVIHHLRFIWSKNYLVVSYDSGNLFPHRNIKTKIYSVCALARVWYVCVLCSTISILKPLFKQSIWHKSM